MMRILLSKEGIPQSRDRPVTLSFLSVGLVQQNVADVEEKVLTLLSFMFGVFLLTIYKEKLKIVKKPILSLVPLGVLSLIIGFVPLTVDNHFIVPPLAFCMGLVTTAFGEVSGIAYNNAFMTGNIKRTMLAFGDYIRTKHRPFFTRRNHICYSTSQLCSWCSGVSLFDHFL